MPKSGPNGAWVRHAGLLVAFMLTVHFPAFADSGTTPAPQGVSLTPTSRATILKKIEDIYRPFAALEASTLEIEVNHQDVSQAAGAHRDRLPEFKVRVAAGLFYHANLTDDVLRFTVCHELGHLFGGHPHIPTPRDWLGPNDENGDTVLSSEGQADYYAALKCMRLVLATEDNVAFVQHIPVDPHVRKACDEAHADSTTPLEDSAICQRTAMAGFGMLTLTYPFKISFDTPAREIAPTTIRNTYPSRQCRLDTLMAGALCPRDQQSACLANKLDGRPGARPVCWFRN